MKTVARVVLLGVCCFLAHHIASAQNQQSVSNALQSTSQEQLQREALKWAKYSAQATIVSVVAVTASVVVLFYQVIKLSHATAAQAFLSASDKLQDERLRQDRQYVFDLRDAKTPMSKWDRNRVERVCHNYDVVGIMVRHGMLPKKMIIDSWGNSLYRSWPIVSPLINIYRTQRGQNFWDDYEWLSNEAKQYAVQHGTFEEHPHDAEQWQGAL